MAQAEVAAADDDYDPFAAFDDVIGGTTRDPYPEFAERRRNDPVWCGTLLNTALLPEGFELPSEYVIFRYEDCSRVLRDAKTFTSTGYDDTIGVVMGRNILGMDDPEHRRHRNLVSGAFRERSLSTWEDRYVEPIVRQLIDAFADRGQAELVKELTFQFPVRVTARILGLPEEDFAQFHRWVIELIALGVTIDRGFAASEGLRQYFAGIVADRRQDPRDDVISDLVTAEIDGERLTDEAIYSFLRLLLPAGAETTYRSSGSLLFLLLLEPRPAAGRDRGPPPAVPGHRGGPALRAAAGHDQPHHDHRGRDRRRHHPCRDQHQPVPGHRPTTTRPGGKTPTASTSSAHPSPTWPSPTAPTCAWGCTWPGWRPEWP